MNYPSEEQDSSESMEVPRGSADQNNSFHESFGECRDDEEDTDDDRKNSLDGH